MEQWLASKRIIKIGGIGAGSATDDIPKVLAATIGLPLQVVAGYKGTSEVRLAFNSGEIEGICNAWESFKSTWRRELDANEVALVLQAIPTRHREVPNVPLAIDYAKTDEAKRMIRSVIHTIAPTVRPYVLPPGTSKGSRRNVASGFYEHDEGSGISRRGGQSEARYKSTRWGNPGERTSKRSSISMLR